MFWTTSQAAMNHDLLNEVATSSFVADPTLLIYAVLGAVAVATLAASYLIFGRPAEQTLPLQY